MKDRIIIVCVVALVLINSLFVYWQYQVDARNVTIEQVQLEEEMQQKQERVEWVSNLLERQQSMLTSILSDYKGNAYSSDVDRIAEQQLIATEYQLMLLQLIAQQNVLMIELLAGG